MAKTPDKNIDIALEYMEKHHPGPHTFHDIGKFCGCNPQAIEKTYYSAMRKVRQQITKEELKKIEYGI